MKYRKNALLSLFLLDLAVPSKFIPPHPFRGTAPEIGFQTHFCWSLEDRPHDPAIDPGALPPFVPEVAAIHLGLHRPQFIDMAKPQQGLKAGHASKDIVLHLFFRLNSSVSPSPNKLRSHLPTPLARQ